MPIYEYACEACGHRFEKLMRIGAEPPPCPECGAAQAKKLVSASAFVLKGSGWYKDHYGLKKGASAGTSSSDSAKGAGSSSTSGASSSGASSSGGSTGGDGSKAAS